MSHTITTEVVPAVTHIAGEGYGDLKPWHEIVTNRELYVEENPDPGEEFEIESSGWKVYQDKSKPENRYGRPWEETSLGKHRTILCAVIARKGDKKVYLWNSSQYAHVGDHRISVSADDEETLTDFVADVAPHAFSYLDAPGVAEQWG